MSSDMKEKVRGILEEAKMNQDLYGNTHSVNRIEVLARRLLEDLECECPRKVMSGDTIEKCLNGIQEDIEALKIGLEDFRQWRRDHFISTHDKW